MEVDRTPFVNPSVEFSRPGLSYEKGRYAGYDALFAGNKDATLREADWNWLSLHISPMSLALQSGAAVAGTFSTVTTGTLTVSSLIQGSALFAGPGGVITQSNPFFFFDNANSRLGIGTSSPSVALDVNGDIRDRNMTAGSVLFAGTGGVVSQNNASFFWDNTNSRLGLGVNSGFQSARLDVGATLSSGVGQYLVYMTSTTTNTGTGHDYTLFVQTTANPSADSDNGPIGLNSTGQTNVGNTKNFTGEFIGVVGAAKHYGTGTLTTAEGVKIHSYAAATGTVTNLYGLKSQFGAFHDTAPYTASAGVVTAGYGVYSLIVMDNASTATTLHCFHSDPASIATSGTITTVVGMYLDAITLTGGGAVTNKYGIYQVGSGDQNYLNGKLGLGTLPTSGYQLEIKAPNANGILFNTASGSAQMNMDWADNGTTKWQLIKTTTNNFRFLDSVAGTDCITLSTGPKVGFFGATPVVKPAGTGETVGFTTGTGTTVHDDSTFTGNVGATAYRISDVVKALKNLGLLTS